MSQIKITLVVQSTDSAMICQSIKLHYCETALGLNDVNSSVCIHRDIPAIRGLVNQSKVRFAKRVEENI